MDAKFAQRKAATLSELALDAGDFSRAGHVDQRARPVVALVNRHPDFFTTSSCAGRVSLFADPTPLSRADGQKGGEWVYVNHDPADVDDIIAAVRKKLGEDTEGETGDETASHGKTPISTTPVDPECTLVMRFEPFILSVEASSVETGGKFVAAARDAGFRESGITGNDKRVVCSIRCSIRMETPVVSRGVRLVSDNGIRELVRIANEKWDANVARAKRLEERIEKVFGDEMDTGGSSSANNGLDENGTSPRPDLENDASPSPSPSQPTDQWVLTVDAARAKPIKDCVKTCGWLDKSRKAGLSSDGKVLLPITEAGAKILQVEVDLAKDSQPPLVKESWQNRQYMIILCALLDGVASVVKSGDVGDKTQTLATRVEKKNPAALIRVAALATALEDTACGGTQARHEANAQGEIPTKWEKLGSLALLPSESFRSETAWPPESRPKLYQAVAEALGVNRLARQAEVSQGPKRESRAEMLWDPENQGGWVETKELGVWYGLDVTKVMFSSGNGTEKARMGNTPAAGEIVVDLYAGIGYYTLQLLHHAGVAKVVACEWNPHSVYALRENLKKNGIDESRYEVREGDNRRVAPTGVADRVVLGLLPDSERAWPTAVAALRDSGGVLHVHGNVASGEETLWTRRLEQEVSNRAAALGRDWSVRVEHVERVKWYAPRVRHLVADVRCVPARLTSAWAHAVGASTSTSPSGTPTGSVTRASSYDVLKETPKMKPASSYSFITPGHVKTRAQVFESPSPSEPNSPTFGLTAKWIPQSAKNKTGVVRRMHRPLRGQFQQGPLTQREPCVLTGLDVGTAPWTWSPKHLASKPDVAATEISVHVSKTPHLDFVRKNFSFENVKFGELLKKLDLESENKKPTEWFYLRSIGKNPRKEPAHALAQFPDLASELKVPGSVLWGATDDNVLDPTRDEKYFSAVLRCSSGGTRLWTHYDAMDNALIQLYGEKRVLLFPPTVAAGLYLDGSSSPIVGPEVDGEGIPYFWPKQFPAYKAARRAAIEVTLQPGDVLFIPALWAHHTEAVHGPSIAVNVFWRELDKKQYPAKDLYGNADPVVATEALNLCQAAASKLAALPTDHKAFYGGIAASRLLRDLRVDEQVASTVAYAKTAEEKEKEKLIDERITENSYGGVFALPVYWSDAAKGAAVGIGVLVAWRRFTRRD